MRCIDGKNMFKDTLRVAIRTDASVRISSGHVMRCLTLAEELSCRGAEVSFICRELQGNLCDIIEKKGYKVKRLPVPEGQMPENTTLHGGWLETEWETDAKQTIDFLTLECPGELKTDWLIIDHYALDIHWESAVRPYVKKIMVIDDLADRVHDCDLLLDQNPCDRMETRYDGLVPHRCVKLLGPEFALVRSEFKEAGGDKPTNGKLERIFVFYGGVDLSNETEKAIKAVRCLNRSTLSVDVVVGMANPYREHLRNLCLSIPNLSFHCQVDNMAELMARADLALGAGGITTFERMYMDLPSITVSTALNQVNILEFLDREGYLRFLGEAEKVAVGDISKAILDFELKGCHMRRYKFNITDNYFWHKLNELVGKNPNK